MWTRETPTSAPPKESPIVQPDSPALPAEERRVVAWVGKSVVFKGTLTSSEDMTIDGHVEGTIEMEDNSLTVGPDADINADIVAKTLTIHGTVVGNVRASVKVDIRPTGARIDVFRERIGTANCLTQSPALLRVQGESPPATRVQNPQAHPVTVGRRGAALSAGFAPVFDVNTEHSLDGFLADRERVIAHARETNLVARRMARLRPADPVLRVAERAAQANRAGVFRTRQTSAH